MIQNTPNNAIQAYTAITSFNKIGNALERLQPVHPGWQSFVAQRSVRAIELAAQSDTLWIATWGGVICWNQQETVHRRYNSEHGLAGNAIACICLDTEELPWVGHVEGGLSYFREHRWHMYEYLSSTPLRALCSDRAGNGIWAASDDTVYYIAGCEQAPEAIISESKRSTAVIEAQALLSVDDGLLLGNAWGLFLLSRHTSILKQIEPANLHTCTALTRDQDGVIWVGSTEGVYKMEENSFRSGPIAPDRGFGRIRELASSRGFIWCLSTRGLFQIGNNQNTRQHLITQVHVKAPDTSSSVLQTIAARPDEQYIWIGTDRQPTQDIDNEHSPIIRGKIDGVAESLWDTKLLPYQPEDRLNNLGQCIAQQTFGGAIWIGTAGKLATFTRDQTRTIVNFNDVLPTDNDNIRTLAISKEGRDLWCLSQWHRVGYWRSSQHYYDYKNKLEGILLALAIGQNGLPYVLTGRELRPLYSDHGIKTIVSHIPTNSSCLVQTQDQTWWMGTAQGVYALRQNAEAWVWELSHEYPGPGSSGVRALTCINNDLWAVTETGVWIHTNEGWSSCIVLSDDGTQVDDKLTDIRTLAPSSRYPQKLWLARSHSIVLTGLHDKDTCTLEQTYTVANSGLGSYRVTALAEIGHELWIVTQAGISRYTLDA